MLVRSLTSASAARKTFELVAERGPATKDFDVLFAALDADTSGELDAVRDAPNMPLPQEPERVREDLRRLAALEPHEHVNLRVPARIHHTRARRGTSRLSTLCNGSPP